MLQAKDKTEKKKRTYCAWDGIMYLNKRPTPHLIKADTVPSRCYLKNRKLSWFAASSKYSLQNKTNKQTKKITKQRKIIFSSKCKFLFFICLSGWDFCLHSKADKIQLPKKCQSNQNFNSKPVAI